MLTFGLFVGLAVLAVGLYAGFVLRVEIRDAAHRTLSQQAERIMVLIEEAETPEARIDVLRDVSRFTVLRAAALLPDSILLDSDGARPVRETEFASRPEVRAVIEGEEAFAEREVDADETVLYTAYRSPRSGIIVHIGQPEPPLLVVLRRMQVALIAGVTMALLLSILGSWVAANQVTRPLQAIRDSARSICEGEFHESIRVESRAAEFQDLARRLNQMSAGYRSKIDELQRLTRLQNEFIGNVSHEVRNPIFAVGGYLEALASEALKPDQRQRYAEKGLANLQRLHNLFNDLIEIARLEYREDLIQLSRFDLNELLEEVVEMLRPKADQKNLHLVAENPVVYVNADRNRIRQVLTNLIDNAIAYTDEGAVRCRIRRRLEKVRVEVVDTGRGIAEEHLGRVFERFYRVDPDRSRKSGGTGLGLSIVKQILHAHGEQIHVESTPGRGSRFWFELPYAGGEA